MPKSKTTKTKTKSKEITNDNQLAEQQSLAEFAENAYLNYSMYVILDRALPNISDGLKPVQRRIVYAMSELGLKAIAKFKKSARTIGDVLGKYHPHGDSACYEALVLMAQPFSYRYPLVQGQGNFGSIDDPKSFAAMRYTECRLSRYAELLLKELGQGTVNWQPNFDGTLEEPIMLPARVPNLLLNGSTGIAVGMATDIPPHNMREVINACIAILDNSKTTLNDVLKHIKGPDFPTTAEIITPQSDIQKVYTEGVGSIKMRATYTKENGKIVINALPYQVSPAKVLEQIAAQMQAKKLPWVEDLRDESDHENPVRLVVVPRSNRVDFEQLLAHLFATTDLEKNFRINLNMIGLDGRPKVKTLLTILQEWLEFRLTTVRRRLQFRLDKVVERLHILEGLMIAYLNIDEVIAIIRREDKPKPKLMERFKLTDTQAEAILELKLRHLAKLEEFKIKSEQDELAKERDHIESILASEKKLKNLVKQELQSDAKEYGDERLSPIIAREEAKAIREEEMLPTEPVTIILSKKGWVRIAKGHEIDATTLNYKAGDSFKSQVFGRSNQQAVFLDSTGRSYSILAHKLPSARGQGEPLTSKFTSASGATFEALLTGNDEELYLLASDAGYGFIAKLSDLYCKNRAGKSLLRLPNNSKVLPPLAITDLEAQYIAAITTEGHMLLFPVADLPILPRGKGNKIIQINPKKVAAREEFVTQITLLNENSSLVVHAGKHKIKLSPQDLANFQGERGRRGNKLPKAYRNVSKVEAN